MSVTRRQRTIPPMMWDDETLMELETDVRMTGLGLYVYVDDHGRGSATPKRVRSSLWPLSETVTTDQVAEHLEWLEQAGFLQLYEAEGRRYLSILEWPSQDHPKPSTIPEPPRGSTFSTSSRRPLEVLGVEERERDERAREGGREGSEGGGRASESEEGAAGTVDPSTPFCPKHPSGTYGKCGPCGTARRAHETWLKQQTDKARTDLDDDEDDR